MIDHLAGCMHDGYTPDQVNKTFYALQQSATEPLDLWCIWDYFDDWGFGGDSEFYIAARGGQLHEVSERLWTWLYEHPGSLEAASGPGAPETWFGAPADDIDLGKLYADVCNLALEDRS